MPNDIDKDAIYGDPEPASARPPKRKKIDPAKAHIPDIPPLDDPLKDATKFKPHPDILKDDWKRPEPVSLPNHKKISVSEYRKKTDPDDPSTWPLELQREYMELKPYMDKTGDDFLSARHRLKEKKDKARALHVTPEDFDRMQKLDPVMFAATMPEPKGRRPAQLEQRPKKGAPVWGSKCKKHKASFSYENCLTCEYYAAACKGYPAAFNPEPKILEHVLPVMYKNGHYQTAAVYWALKQTVRTWDIRKENFAISWASNDKISELSAVPKKKLYIHYRLLEIEYGLIRKQTDNYRDKQTGKYKRRNFFDLSPVFKPFVLLRNFENQLKGRNKTELFQKRRRFISMNRRSANRERGRN
jgi:hypothetical protein